MKICDLLKMIETLKDAAGATDDSDINFYLNNEAEAAHRNSDRPVFIEMETDVDLYTPMEYKVFGAKNPSGEFSIPLTPAKN